MEGVENVNDLTVIYLVSSFGFSGSPGERVVWGRATEEFHRAHRPAHPRRDMAGCFDAKVLVDDGVLVEPWVGLRPWVSAEVFEKGIRMLLGDKAVNEEKDRIEGAFKTTQTIWGVIMDTESETAALPERRIQKGALLLAEPGFDFGDQTATLKQLQQYRGIVTGWASVVHGLENELKAADKFLAGTDGHKPIQPKLRGEGSPQWETQVAWTDLWELFETCRWLSARTDRWESFTTGLKTMLPVMERLSLPGEWEKVIWVSSDATPTMVGAIDWTNRKVMRAPTGLLRHWAKKAMSDLEITEQDPEMVIHMGEMLSFVTFACKLGEDWKQAVVLYAGDNTVVRSWLQTRRTRTRGGRILIRVLNMAEMKYGFVVVAGWWRTYHNVDADYITRCSEEEYKEYIQTKNLGEVDILEGIQQALEDSERYGPCFLWGKEDGDDRALQIQLRERRVSRQVQRSVKVPWASFAVAEWSAQGRKVRDFEALGGALGAALEEPGGRPTISCATIRVDRGGHHLRRALEDAEKKEAWVGLVEGPRQVPWEFGERWCERKGWDYGLIEYVTTEHGEAMARRRRGLVWSAKGELPEFWEGLLVRSMGASPMGTVLQAKDHDDPCWVKPYKLELESGIPRDRLLPQPVGHLWWTQSGDREVVHGLGGPCKWPLMQEPGRSVQKRTGGARTPT